MTHWREALQLQFCAALHQLARRRLIGEDVVAVGQQRSIVRSARTGEND